MILANGFNWQRYRVQFENGAELGDLDSRQIEPIGRAAKRLAKAAAKAAALTLTADRCRGGTLTTTTGSGAAW